MMGNDKNRINEDALDNVSGGVTQAASQGKGDIKKKLGDKAAKKAVKGKEKN